MSGKKMGKRKDKTTQGSRSRRRQILQLDDDSNHSYPNPAWQVGCSNQAQESNVQEEADAEGEKKVHPNPLSGLLSHYMDSDDENEESAVEFTVANGTKDESNGSANGDKTNRIDLEVADFLKEIDALTTTDDGPNDESAAKEKNSSLKLSNGSSENSREASSSTDPCTSKTVAVSAAWQECYDDTTGYTYYWNTISNQVTWDCPEDFHLHKDIEKKSDENLKSDVKQQNDQKEGNCVKNKENISTSHSSPQGEKRDHSSDEEGKIEPITFYGPSSSNDESSSDDDHGKHWKKRRKRNEDEAAATNTTNPCELKELKEPAPNFGDELSSPVGIGPQLPPGYVLPETESPELVNPHLSAEFSSPIASQENSIPSCDIDLTSHLQELSPTSTAQGTSLETNKISLALVVEEASEDCISPDQNRESEPVLITDSISPPTVAPPTSVCEPSFSQLCYLDETEEPDSTTRGRQNKLDADIEPAPPGISSEMGSLFLGPRNIPQILPTMDDDSEEDKSEPCDAQIIISSSATVVAPSFYEDDNMKANANTRCGFGFKTQEIFASTSNGEANKQHNSKISFVKAETLDLNAINRQVVSEWTTNTKEIEDEQTNNIVSGVTTPHSATSNTENDIDEIDRELDLAFERKKKAVSSSPDDARTSILLSSSTDLTSSLSSSLLSKLAEKRQRNNRTDEPVHKKTATLESLQSEEIGDLASSLFNRLASLGVVEENISTLHSYSIQIKTRLDDWRNGALESSYVLACLHQIEEDLCHQELEPSTACWGDHLDRISNRQTNSVSGKDWWELPEAERPDTTGKSKVLDAVAITKNNLNTSPEQEKLRSFTISSSNSNSVSSSTGPSAGNMLVMLPSYPPVPTEHQISPLPPLPPAPPDVIPPPPPPPESPPPPDSTETEENEIVDMDVDEPSLPSNIVHTHSTDIVSLSLTPPLLADGQLTITSDQNAATKENAFFVISKPPIPLTSASVASLENPSCSRQPDFQMELSSFYSDITSLSVEPEEPQIPNVQVYQAPLVGTSKLVPSVTSTETIHLPGPSHSVASTSGTSSNSMKKEKKLKKTKMSTGLVLKKKNMPSLVEKWQKIKQEQARHSSSSDEECVSTTKQFEDF